jgi:predicted permease
MPDQPGWREQIRPHVASLRLDPVREAEIVEEISQHLDERYEELLHAGSTPEHARRQTLDEMLEADTFTAAMRTLRQSHAPQRHTPGAAGPSLLADACQDIRQSWRGLKKTRVFTAAAVLTLALGIAGTVTMFSVVHGVLFKPLPYQDPDELVRIVHVIGGIRQPFFSDVVFRSYVDHTQAFSDVGVWIPATTAAITGQGEPEEVRTLTASRSLLTTLGVPPALGRWFSTAEDAPGGAATVMLTHGYWQRKFAGDPAVLSRTLTIDGRPHQIVGIMPSNFRFSEEFEIIRPLRINAAAPANVFRLVGLARLKPGVTLAQGNADVMRVLHAWFERAGTRPEIRARWSPALQPLKDDIVGDVRATLWILMGAIGLVLLMACANVANLLLVRADGRRRELAIRAALGAGGLRIARQLLVETLLLTALGGLAGIALAYGALRALVAIAPANLPRLSDIAIDPAVLGFAVAVSVLSGLLFGLIPVLKHARPRLDALGTGGGRVTRGRQRSQQLLVTAQMALALMLLVGAGLMIRSFQTLRHTDPGFTSPHTLQMFTMRFLPALAQEAEHVTRMQQDLLERLANIPGVSSAAFANRMPMGIDRSSSALTAKGRPDDGKTPPNHQVKVISPDLFRTQGTPLIAGRDFTWADVHGTRDLAIISETLARELFGSAKAAVGQTLREYYDKESPWREVVGVVGNVHDDGVHRDAPTTVYFPARPVQRLFGIPGLQTRRVTFAVRADRAGTPEFLEQVRSAVSSSVSASVPLAQVTTLDEPYRRSMARTAFTLLMLAIAGTMALLLGMCGIYGVISYAVSQRRREIGIRLALGAPLPAVRGLFIRRGVLMGAAGLVVGLAGAVAVTRLMKSLLYGVTPLDPMTFAAMPAVLVAAAMLASYLPARAATTVDPVETMRAE